MQTSVASFQPFVDQENAGANLKHADRSRIGLGGKVFNSNSHGQPTPRSALRDVNKGLAGNVQRQDAGNKPLKTPVQSLFQKPAQVSSLPTPSHKKELKIHNDSSKKHKQVVTVQPITKHAVKKPDPLPAREHMHIYREDEEVKSRPEVDLRGVVNMFKNWRPPCWAGSRDDSDSDDDTEEGRRRRTEKLINSMDLPDPVPFPELEFEDFEELPIPYIDEDIPIPFADDSIDIEPNMGTLEIWHLSEPNSPEKKSNTSELGHR